MLSECAGVGSWLQRCTGMPRSSSARRYDADCARRQPKSDKKQVGKPVTIRRCQQGSTKHRTAVTELSASTSIDKTSASLKLFISRSLCAFWNRGKNAKNGHLPPPAQPPHARDLAPGELPAARRRAAEERQPPSPNSTRREAAAEGQPPGPNNTRSGLPHLPLRRRSINHPMRL